MRVVLAAAILGGMSGVADANDSSMSRLTGDSYAYFNAPRSNAPADPAWRPSHPGGLSNREFQALSSDAPAWHGMDKSIFGAFASRSTRSYSRSSKAEFPLSIRGGDEDHDRKEPALGGK
jgi:hypothetical protein